MAHEYNENRSRPRMTGIYILGGVIGLAFVVGGIIALKVVLPGMESRAVAISNMRQLTRAAAIYAFDNDGLTPPCSTWMDGLTPYVPLSSTPFKAPGLSSSQTDPNIFGVSMNVNDGSIPYLGVETPKTLPLFFEGKATEPNASGTFPDSAISRYGTGESTVIPFASRYLAYGLYYSQTKTFQMLNIPKAAKQSGN